MQGAVREIALDIVRADGTRLAALVNSVRQRDDAGRPRVVRTTVFDATDRRAYEQELLRSRRREQEIAQRLQRSLLSGRLATSARLAVDVVYRPAQAPASRSAATGTTPSGSATRGRRSASSSATSSGTASRPRR